MPIKKQSPPPGTFEAFLQRLAKVSPVLARTIKATHVHGHRVYHVSVEDLANGHGLVNAWPVAWQFHVHHHGRPTVHEYRMHPSGPVFQETNFGKNVDMVFALLDKLEDIPELSHGDFEIGLLRLPEIKINAIWLRDTSGKMDKFVPLAPGFYDLKVGIITDNTSFLDIAQTVAREYVSNLHLPVDDMRGN